ncbi:glycosyltransferase family 1 protein [Roseofilum sp. BLCC_M154]|uniref:Glycosyltransferase family 1 protein n=1 Tax=Roseofilum acuticapitatum BLCC-M154 TaxID=3022444 RepID=A0ABT7AR93_9CYAN|nr:hypothetical protein [Roseofilum acuticapitatum]MDJ1169428.1 glycosyltransferase family 1 protein [Roseofilum acuticapitatum BLCC-M154]
MKIYQQALSNIMSKIKLTGQYLRPKVWPNKSIVYYTGATQRVWTPETLKVGLGGSETAIIQLTKVWVKLGYTVTVYNNCGTEAGIYDGVEYRHYSEFNQYDEFDILIIWRYPWRLYARTKAKRIWLDLHEVMQPDQVTKSKLKNFDCVFVKSAYHRSLLPEIEETTIAIIPNGVDPSYFEYSKCYKDPYKLVYASNYIRGLERMLQYGWPIIKKEIPEAHLHIYYGWSGNDFSKPEVQAWKEKMIALMNQSGVTDHGRIGVEKLIQEKSTASIHYYGCTFQEIDCISVRESAAVGCVPVTTDYVALSEKNYCMKAPGNPYKQTTQEAVAMKIIELLNNQDRLEEIRQEFQQLAQEETWENSAKLWLNYH